MLTHFLQLNSTDTEFLCIMSRAHLARYGRDTLELGSVMFAPADTVHSLESALDGHISMAVQVNYQRAFARATA